MAEESNPIDTFEKEHTHPIHWAWHAVYLILAIPLITALLLVLVSTSLFVEIDHVYWYVTFGVVALLLGLLCSWITQKLVRAKLLFLLSGSLLTGIAAGIVTFTLRTLEILEQHISDIPAQTGMPSEIISLFGTAPHALLSGTIILLGLIIPYLVFWFKDPEKNGVQLSILLLLILVFLLLSVIAPFLVELSFHGALHW